jgi:hypothetical protein
VWFEVWLPVLFEVALLDILIEDDDVVVLEEEVVAYCLLMSLLKLLWPFCVPKTSFKLSDFLSLMFEWESE